ncbi:acyl-CoA dehydrogenase [Actinomycetospora sp. NBRC 106378]|uniref:acyl-CoA dehydrogenase n=1 Tax=Actinomycetospora sp. NBRC 106378 TaxID=3032208 RepID=UPI0024A2A9EE|nr:acyl-CoA dehydrogenase [Actinomycetospora sp. NBRC 106378]GLZ55720.1 acyl-CoA dehydrogenase [Actinomycetospora sp. NBRC 106378]
MIVHPSAVLEVHTVPPGLSEVLDDLAAAPDTAGRWRVLAALGARDLVAARLAEAHADATGILRQLGGEPPGPDSLWGVWAARAPHAVVEADHGPDGWTLSGASPWSSGSDRCTDALVVAGDRLFAVRLDRPTVVAGEDPWRGLGMAGSGTTTVRFHHTPARPVGEPGDYLDRPGFWHAAAGVAAVWFGGAVGATDPLRRRVRDGRGDAHDAAHLGRVDAALGAAAALLREAAAAADADVDTVDAARRRALVVRATVEVAVETALRSTGRATGPGPLAHDARHARHVADLEVYVRQSHAERDLATLGGLAATAPEVTL